VAVCEGVLLCPHASADTTANEWTGLHFKKVTSLSA
jgi:hypothetical protein